VQRKGAPGSQEHTAAVRLQSVRGLSAGQGYGRGTAAVWLQCRSGMPSKWDEYGCSTRKMWIQYDRGATVMASELFWEGMVAVWQLYGRGPARIVPCLIMPLGSPCCATQGQQGSCQQPKKKGWVSGKWHPNFQAPANAQPQLATSFSVSDTFYAA